eukprot:TRINITY_DN14767_c0_g1_i1.p1 TRINITY_DN14767_c0_g1~~TRINITY_DN14767_c0_g1_i1.p1  ORF type:complete len:611 (+),score=152.06 TRINITY_DN14767_c0_g1_i1:129-1835(+)
MTPLRPAQSAPAPSAESLLSENVDCVSACASWRQRAACPQGGALRAVNYMTGARVQANRWENRSAEGPTPRPRSGHTFLVHPPRNTVVMFGGLGDDVDQTGLDPVLSDVWVHHLGEHPRWQELSCTGEMPPGVFGHTAELLAPAADTLSMITYGGQTAGGLLSGDLHVLSDIYGEPVWRRISVSEGVEHGNISRWGHSMVALREDDGTVSQVTGEPVPPGGNLQLIVCGGMGEGFRSLDDVVAFDVAAARWHVLAKDRDLEQQEAEAEQRPVGRRRHVAVLGEEGHMWLFGGRSGWNSFHDDLWRFDIGLRRWTRIKKTPGARWPLPRTGHCGARVADQLYVFGGFELRKGENSANPNATEWEYMLYDDLWRFSLSSGTWEQLNPDEAHTDLMNVAGSYGGREQEVNWAARLADSRRVREEGTKRSEGGALAQQLLPGAEKVPCHVCADRSEPCRAPRQRSMAAAFVHCGRLFIHGGRDKAQASDCFFSLPLEGGARSTLCEHVAQLIADRGIPYWDLDLPEELTEYLDTLFKASDETLLRSPLPPRASSIPEDDGGPVDGGTRVVMS